MLISIHDKVILFKVTFKAFPLLKITTVKCYLPRFCNKWNTSPKFQFNIDPGRKLAHMIQSSIKNDSNLKWYDASKYLPGFPTWMQNMSVIICLLPILFGKYYVFADRNGVEICRYNATYVRMFYTVFRYILDYCFCFLIHWSTLYSKLKYTLN